MQLLLAAAAEEMHDTQGRRVVQGEQPGSTVFAMIFHLIPLLRQPHHQECSCIRLCLP